MHRPPVDTACAAAKRFPRDHDTWHRVWQPLLIAAKSHSLGVVLAPGVSWDCEQDRRPSYLVSYTDPALCNPASSLAESGKEALEKRGSYQRGSQEAVFPASLHRAKSPELQATSLLSLSLEHRRWLSGPFPCATS